MIHVFFRPRSIAVIGASATKGSVGNSILNSLKNFKGRVYPVNPKHKKINGLWCYGSIKDIKNPVDMGVIAVPNKAVAAVLRECVEKKVNGVVIVNSGYSEIGNREDEDELKKIIKNTKTRIIGVNCLGVLDTITGVDTLFLPEPELKRPKPGGISFLSQSGAFGSTLLDLISYENIGVAKFVSYGNQTDVKDWELLEYLGRDQTTKVIIIYIEGVSDGRKFMNIAKKIKKPILIFKAGKTEAGSRSAASHTGAVAGSYDVYKAAFKQTGVFEVDSVEEMYDAAKALEFQNTFSGNVAVVTNGGGFGVIASDYLIKSGLTLATFSEQTTTKLKKILPAYASIHNPLDLIGDADHIRYEKALDVLIRDNDVKAILIIALLQPVSMTPRVIDVIKRVKKKTEKPFVVCSTGGTYTEKHVPTLEKAKIPVYITPERAVRSLKALSR